MAKATIITLLSDRHEFSYRFHDALLSLPWVSERFNILKISYSPGDEPMPDLKKYNADGIITAISPESENMELLCRSCDNVVNISNTPHPGTSSLYTCPEYLAKLITTHAIGAGYDAVGFTPTVGMDQQIKEQGEILKQSCLTAGLDYWQECVEERPLGVTMQQWSNQHQSLIAKIRDCQHRTLIYAFHDWRASTLLQLCQQLDILVPQQIGILGRGNTINSKCGSTRISSIDPSYLHLANTAMEIIQSQKHCNQRLSQGSISPRESTVHTITKGHFSSKIDELILHHGAEGISVDELAKIIGISRSSLERNYRKSHGIPPSAALKKIRLQHIERLLKTTNLTVNAIAEMSGFSSTRSFYTMFNNAHGITPSQWRKIQSD